MTTSPTRIIDPEFKIALENILDNQSVKPDFMVLNLPKIFKRTGEVAIIPDFVSRNNRIRVNLVDDIGPITKILPTIDLVDNDNDVIISFDDDVLYNKDCIKNLVEASIANPTYIISFHTGTKFIEGFLSVLYKRMHFVDFDKSVITLDDNCFRSDDYLIANHIFKKRFTVMKLQRLDSNSMDFGFKSDALHKQAEGHLENYKKCAQVLEDNNKLYIRNNDGELVHDFFY